MIKNGKSCKGDGIKIVARANADSATRQKCGPEIDLESHAIAANHQLAALP